MKQLIDMKITFYSKVGCEACNIAHKNIVEALSEIDDYVSFEVVFDKQRIEENKIKEFPTVVLQNDIFKRKVVGSFSKDYILETINAMLH